MSGVDACPALNVLRISHSDPHPDGPGFVARDVAWPVSQVRNVTEQRIAAGSLGIIENCFSGQEEAITLLAWVMPTRLADRSVIASWQTADGTLLVVIDRGRLVLELVHADKPRGRALLTSPHELHERVWYFVAAGFNSRDGIILLAWAQSGRTGGPYVLTGEFDPLPRPDAGSPLVLGGMLDRGPQPIASLDGKISGPTLIGNTPDAIALMDVMNWGVEQALTRVDLLARWAFGPDDNLDQVTDISGHGRHGRLVNAPSLGVTGPPTIGSPDIAPMLSAGTAYDTVYFHSDDLEDCGWPDTHEVSVPATAPSGIYVVRASDATGKVDLPFVVEPADAPPVLLVLPTFTWQAYANLGRDPAQYPGLSHYALHRDGSPVYVTTRLKPMPTIEPGARLEVDGLDSFAGNDMDSPGAATHLLMADLYVNRWLERSGVSFGVVTDATIHSAGDAAFHDCRTAVLSAHPEYWTGAMLDALESFMTRGGSVLYLGGNGLYWVTSVHPDRPHLLEVRRQAGSQTSSAEPGEARHVFDSQPGGIWSACGRPPDWLLNVGFAGFGWDTGIPYERTEASRGSEFAWIFDGIESDSVGSEGLNMGGAVSIEFDRYQDAFAPSGTTVLASARPSRGGFFRSFEGGMGRAPDPLVRCDMTIRETPAGGLVFSLGSIAASGCLSVRDGQNDLARICTNVLRRTLS